MPAGPDLQEVEMQIQARRGVLHPAQNRGTAVSTSLEAAAARYVSALADIVATLGPDTICSCVPPDDCGLPEEAAYALQIAQNALAGRPHDWVDEAPK